MESDLDEVRGLTEKVAPEQSPEGGEGALWLPGGKSIARQRRQQVGSPGVRESLNLRHSRYHGVPGADGG